jgi:hypothetical protein
MSRFDTVLKEMFLESPLLVAAELAGGPVQEWLNIEFPRTRNVRADLLERGQMCGSSRRKKLLANENIGDSLMAILCRMEDRRDVVRQILACIDRLEEAVGRICSLGFGIIRAERP